MLTTGSFPDKRNMTPDYTKKKRKGDMWCPYCGEWRKFSSKVHKWSSHKHCPGCHISTVDFYVKTTNKTWGFGIKPAERRK